MAVFLVNGAHTHATRTRATRADYVTLIKIMPAIHQRGSEGESLTRSEAAGGGAAVYL